MRAKWLALIGLSIFIAATATAGDWPQFRGPGGRGTADGKQLPAERAAKNTLGKIKIPGGAGPPPIIGGDNLSAPTAITEKQAKPKPFRFPGGGDGPPGKGGFPPKGDGKGPPMGKGGFGGFGGMGG